MSLWFDRASECGNSRAFREESSGHKKRDETPWALALSREALVKPIKELPAQSYELREKSRSGGLRLCWRNDRRTYFIIFRRMVPKAPIKPVPSNSKEEGSGTVPPPPPMMSKAPMVWVPFEPQVAPPSVE